MAAGDVVKQIGNGLRHLADGVAREKLGDIGGVDAGVEGIAKAVFGHAVDAGEAGRFQLRNRTEHAFHLRGCGARHDDGVVRLDHQVRGVRRQEVVTGGTQIVEGLGGTGFDERDHGFADLAKADGNRFHARVPHDDAEGDQLVDHATESLVRAPRVGDRVVVGGAFTQVGQSNDVVVACRRRHLRTAGQHHFPDRWHPGEPSLWGEQSNALAFLIELVDPPGSCVASASADCQAHPPVNQIGVEETVGCQRGGEIGTTGVVQWQRMRSADMNQARCTEVSHAASQLRDVDAEFLDEIAGFPHSDDTVFQGRCGVGSQ